MPAAVLAERVSPPAHGRACGEAQPLTAAAERRVRKSVKPPPDDFFQKHLASAQGKKTGRPGSVRVNLLDLEAVIFGLPSMKP